jgi:hypothetical protein
VLIWRLIKFFVQKLIFMSMKIVLGIMNDWID